MVVARLGFGDPDPLPDGVAIRAVQVDYVPAFFSDVRSNVRVQTGVVFRFEW